MGENGERFCTRCLRSAGKNTQVETAWQQRVAYAGAGNNCDHQPGATTEGLRKGNEIKGNTRALTLELTHTFIYLGAINGYC